MFIYPLLDEVLEVGVVEVCEGVLKQASVLPTSLIPGKRPGLMTFEVISGSPHKCKETRLIELVFISILVNIPISKKYTCKSDFYVEQRHAKFQ